MEVAQHVRDDNHLLQLRVHGRRRTPQAGPGRAPLPHLRHLSLRLCNRLLGRVPPQNRRPRVHFRDERVPERRVELPRFLHRRHRHGRHSRALGGLRLHEHPPNLPAPPPTPGAPRRRPLQEHPDAGGAAHRVHAHALLGLWADLVHLFHLRHPGRAALGRRAPLAVLLPRRRGDRLWKRGPNLLPHLGCNRQLSRWHVQMQHRVRVSSQLPQPLLPHRTLR
mmetsp:Transcript_59772/g.136610  ORF Transcript_59772/g.136610 Transcript_59772/m.136610 type:complete len:222 (+) Transcript_59772:433-1098(+)